MSTNAAHIAHRDDEGSKIGMWLFIFTEILLFGGLFIVYSVYRFINPVAFKLAAENLDVGIGTVNTVILLISSMFIAMSVTAIQLGNSKRTVLLLGLTILLGVIFLINKYFEWAGKIGHGLYPGSEELSELGQGEVLFFGLYFFMTGLHALHIIIGLTIISIMIVNIQKGKITQDYYVQLENTGLYWHLVDLIWIFLFPLFYLIT